MSESGCSEPSPELLQLLDRFVLEECLARVKRKELSAWLSAETKSSWHGADKKALIGSALRKWKLQLFERRHNGRVLAARVLVCKDELRRSRGLLEETQLSVLRKELETKHLRADIRALAVALRTVRGAQRPALDEHLQVECDAAVEQWHAADKQTSQWPPSGRRRANARHSHSRHCAAVLQPRTVQASADGRPPASGRLLAQTQSTAVKQLKPDFPDSDQSENDASHKHTAASLRTEDGRGVRGHCKDGTRVTAKRKRTQDGGDGRRQWKRQRYR